MSKPDTFAEVVRWLEGRASFEWTAADSPWCSSVETELHKAHARAYSKAARLLAAAGEEVRAWRAWKKCVVRYMTAEVPSPHEKIERMQKARAALNALAPELKENDQ